MDMRGSMHADMYVDMCVDMSVDISVDMCVGMCAGMYVGMYVDMCVGMCVGISAGMYVDMCADMCVDICADKVSLQSPAELGWQPNTAGSFRQQVCVRMRTVHGHAQIHTGMHKQVNNPIRTSIVYRWPWYTCDQSHRHAHTAQVTMWPIPYALPHCAGDHIAHVANPYACP